MTLWGAVMAAGAAGAVCRHLVDLAITTRVRGRFPWGTLAVNLSGSLLVGVVAGLATNRAVSDGAAMVAGAGFCGAYTTFSTLAYETVRLAEEGAWTPALLNLASLAVGAAAAAAGWAITLL